MDGENKGKTFFIIMNAKNEFVSIIIFCLWIPATDTFNLKRLRT